MGMYVLRRRRSGRNQVQYVRDGIVEDLALPKRLRLSDGRDFRWGDDSMASFNTAFALVLHGHCDEELAGMIALELLQSWVSAVNYRTLCFDELFVINTVVLAADVVEGELRAAIRERKEAASEN